MPLRTLHPRTVLGITGLVAPTPLPAEAGRHGVPLPWLPEDLRPAWAGSYDTTKGHPGPARICLPSTGAPGDGCHTDRPAVAVLPAPLAGSLVNLPTCSALRIVGCPQSPPASFCFTLKNRGVSSARSIAGTTALGIWDCTGAQTWGKERRDLGFMLCPTQGSASHPFLVFAKHYLL